MPEMALADGILERPLKIRTVLVGGFVVLSAAVGGTAYLTQNSMESRSEALQLQVTEMQRKLEARAAGPAENSQNKNEDELKNRLAGLEQEKQALQAQLAEMSVGALSPDSELGGLLRQLKSENRSQRLAAVRGLVELGDPRSVPAVVDYYWRDPDEATVAVLATRYMDFVWANDRAVGLDFMLRIMQSDREQYASWAYEELEQRVIDKQTAAVREKMVSALQEVALTSKDALVRTRAKLLLKQSSDWVAKFPDDR